MDIFQQYSQGIEPGSGLKEKNGYQKKESARKDVNNILRANGFSWVKSQDLDVAQGETGTSSWQLQNEEGKGFSVKEALAFIYGQDKANLIPKRGGKVRSLAPSESWNAIEVAVKYSL